MTDFTRILNTPDYVGAHVSIPDYPSRTIQGQAGYRMVPWDDWVGMRQRALDLAAFNKELIEALEKAIAFLDAMPWYGSDIGAYDRKALVIELRASLKKAEP